MSVLTRQTGSTDTARGAGTAAAVRGRVLDRGLRVRRRDGVLHGASPAVRAVPGPRSVQRAAGDGDLRRHRVPSELRAAARPPARAEITATAANLGGLGLGALLAGLLAQYAWAPLRLPYLVTEALMLAAVIGLVLAPETVARPRPRPR